MQCCLSFVLVLLQCLQNPYRPQYLGGILKNPEFDSGLEGWNILGMGRIGAGTSSTGNKFILAYNRRLPNDTFTQGIYLQKEILYTFSGKYIMQPSYYAYCFL